MTSNSCSVIAISNQKGGVGKTTTTVNLGQALAGLGYKVLMIDLDPQGNATQGLGLPLESVQASIAELLRDRSLPDDAGIYQGSGFDLIPATPLLAAVEREMPGITNSELRLAHRVSRLRDKYQFILIDNAPGFGPLMNSAFNACDSVLLPVDSSFYGLTGLKKLQAELETIREGYNPRIHVLGYLLTLYDGTRMAEEIHGELVSVFAEAVFDTRIRRSVRLREAPAMGRTIFQHAPGSSGAEDYLRLAQEVLLRTSRVENSNHPNLRVVGPAAALEVAHER